MGNKKINGADYLLLLLYLNNKTEIKSALRLIKMMFLFENEINKQLVKKVPEEKLSKFMAYNFGPWSKDLYEQLNFFESLEFIKRKEVEVIEEMGNFDNFSYEDDIDYDLINDKDLEENKQNIMYTYSIFGKGIEYVEKEILPYISKNDKNLLEAFKKKICSLTIKQILYYVYKKYPDFTVKSVIKGEVIGDN